MVYVNEITFTLLLFSWAPCVTDSRTTSVFSLLCMCVRGFVLVVRSRNSVQKLIDTVYCQYV